MKYICEICDYSTTSLFNFTRHQNRVRKCKKKCKTDLVYTFITMNDNINVKISNMSKSERNAHEQ